MSLNVDNCHRCGKVYLKNLHGMCPNCIKDIEAQYEKCLNYLRENRQCNIYDLSEATGVEVKQIIKFIREGRISIKNHANMSYDCEICGTPIKEHAICESCRTRLMKDKANMQEDEQRRKDQAEQENHVSFKIKDRLQNRNK
ncbi:flagellar protein [Paenibacillus filicis]|uniref:Flagellar protein n=1 Tax=Paenibacillus gyeongsangnamensis TaxID=3388067 RepID=A0ABT4QDB0_9BACL|nr:flagellar protein [Paenibacillus filicis]MCZ8514869.1 flagellar protein [Paenibacillus filicis]